MTGTASGWALLLFAGAANATFGLPMKYVRRWQWENTWAAWTLFALLVLPITAAVSGIPSLTTLYSGPGLHAASLVGLFGGGWGLAQVLFGKAIDRIGIGLAFSIVLGLSAACGTLLPLLHLPTQTPAAVTIRIACGLLLVAFGVAACAFAGRRREAAQSNPHLPRTAAPRSFTPGLLMALASGVLASLMNVGIAYGGPLLARAAAQGLGPTRSMYAVWLPLMLGGAFPNLLYCAWLLRSRRTSALFHTDQMRNFGLAALMAVLWFFSTVLYGLATQWLGGMGLVLGWPVFMSVIVITAGLLGIASGEWTGTGRAPVLFQSAGIFLLVLAILAFSLAQNALASPASSANHVKSATPANFLSSLATNSRVPHPCASPDLLSSARSFQAQGWEATPRPPLPSNPIA